MKIIDFKKKGNVVRFYLGEDGLEDWGGDDWNDSPYGHNAGEVYDEYIAGYRDIAFPYGFAVVEPYDGYPNSAWCKDDMKARSVPCIVVVPNLDDWWDEDFNKMNADAGAIKFYFGDKMEPNSELEIFKKEEK